MSTRVIDYNRAPTRDLAAAFEWHAAPEPRALADLGWCLVAMIWGAVLMSVALVLL